MGTGVAERIRCMTDIDDTRNVMDEFKGMPHEEIMRQLDSRGSTIEIAIENTLRDYNMGTIVRTANAFGIRTVHVIGRKQWNKRGAMMTDKYLAVVYHDSPDSFALTAKKSGKRLIAVDNTNKSIDFNQISPQSNDILLFGQEGPGISQGLLLLSDVNVHIPQSGSTRSLNVGVAAGILLYAWSK